MTKGKPDNQCCCLRERRRKCIFFIELMSKENNLLCCGLCKFISLQLQCVVSIVNTFLLFDVLAIAFLQLS